MGLMKRFSDIMKAKTSKALDKAEDPRETLDYSYERQLEMVQKRPPGPGRRGHLPQAARAADHPAAGLGGEAGGAGPNRPWAPAGRTWPAKPSAARRGSAPRSRASRSSTTSSAPRKPELTTALQRLQAKVEAFRTKKETIKATYTAAEAPPRSARPCRASPRRWATWDWPSSGPRTRRPQMQARAGAVDELIASGVLDDVTAEPSGDIKAELDKLSASSSVGRRPGPPEGRAGAGSAPPAIEAPPADQPAKEGQ